MKTDINVVKELINQNKEYIKIEPSNVFASHNGLSVKIVLPCFCQANCEFCFNKLTKDTQKHDYNTFFNNLTKSLDMIFNNITNRTISLDITGNEPTYDINVFNKLMDYLKKYKSKVDKIVLTTNGFKLDKCLPSMIGVVDIVNISLHHYNYDIRKQIFNTSYVPSNEQLNDLVKKLKYYNITSTAVAVLYKEYDNFINFYNNFVLWAMNIGFKDVRMRSNFCAKDKFIKEILATNIGNEKIDEVAGLTTKIIKDKKTGFETRILVGVQDLTDYLLGVELVIDDDGKLYIDYNKRFPINDFNVKYFNSIYVYNNLDKSNYSNISTSSKQYVKKRI